MFCLQFTLPHDYAELVASQVRWEGWLDVVDHPQGLGILPPTTTDCQRATIRGIARALMFFGRDNAGTRPQRDWVHFIQHVRSVAAAENITGERQLEMILEWVRAEYRVRAYLLSMSNIHLSKPADRPVETGTNRGDRRATLTMASHAALGRLWDQAARR